MNDLEMCKAMAEIEGIELKLDGTRMPTKGFSKRNLTPPYNPITDIALNCALRDKYEVGIDYNVGSCIVIHGEEFREDCFESNDEIPRVVIECILKANGKYTK
jgi:hypothetical protein